MGFQKRGVPAGYETPSAFHILVVAAAGEVIAVANRPG